MNGGSLPGSLHCAARRATIRRGREGRAAPVGMTEQEKANPGPTRKIGVWGPGSGHPDRIGVNAERRGCREAEEKRGCGVGAEEPTLFAKCAKRVGHLARRDKEKGARLGPS